MTATVPEVYVDTMSTFISDSFLCYGGDSYTHEESQTQELSRGEGGITLLQYWYILVSLIVQGPSILSTLDTSLASVRMLLIQDSINGKFKVLEGYIVYQETLCV